MVDAVVSYAVQKLGDFLIEEVSLRQSLRENVHWLRNELSFMQAFLKDAEKKQAEDHLVLQWIFEITSVANEAVAILETYSLDAAKDGDQAAGFLDRFKVCACICQKEAKFHNIGKDIQSLKERVMDISRKRDTYGITHTNNNAGEGPSNLPNHPSSTLIRTLRRAVSYADEDQLFVGFQEVFQRLLDELLKKEPRRTVLSIYGMGGLGKTTLARNLYNSPSLLSSFQTRAWICISQQYSTPDLLRSIIKSIQGCSEEMLKLLKEMSERDLETHLRNLLKERKYLVVVDDVWHREAWESLKRALPDNNNGSRVILTTRKEDVAERVDDKGFSHKLRFLNKEESWDLLCKKLGPENKMVGADFLFSPSMERLAKEMVEKCRGLPLAIVVLGGLLSYRKGVDEWQNVKTHLWQHMKNDSVEISHILSLSYNDLSFELKQCFLYFGIFQEDHVIHTEKLMHLWLAEGFIPRIREEHMEDIAENFLHELISRSLIQVSETFFDKILACRIHDLLRDLAVQKAMEVNLFDIYDPRVNLVTPFRHRHAIHTQTQRYLSLDLSKLKVRSILLFDKEFKSLDDNKFMMLCTMLQHVYVLDLENIHFDGNKLPDAIGKLVHLKFLGLNNTNILNLPPSIGKLKNLQTLEALIFNNCSCQLPPQVAQLTNLRHLVARYEVPLQVDKLTNLRTLKYICCDQWKDTDASALVNIQELGMEKIMKSYSLKSIGSLKSLTTLFLVCRYGETFPPLQPLSSCENLNRLSLSGKMEELADLNKLPKSIMLLVLESAGLEEDPMPILGKFQNLKHLELSSAYKGNKITCKGNSFGQLETLRLRFLVNLESWHLDTTAMSLIKSLSIFGCPKLRKIPEQMKHVTVFEGQLSIERHREYYRYNGIANLLHPLSF